MRYLITGRAGCIGSHLAESPLEAGDQVSVIDDLSTDSIRNIDSIFNKPLLSELVDDSDCVIHLAAAVGVKLIVESPVRTITLNVEGTSLALDAA
ncbi:MAG: GDP-mannose 4,6-dehydratase [Elusimicrobia bacterium]|nr:GDP-mannose 4,6-dehydratase [Elusimicrobiota bacterium]